VTLNPMTGLANGPSTFQPDTLKNYEAGYKAESADRRFAFDVSAYHINWSNIQIATNSGGFSSIANATGGATVDGAELTLTARPVGPLTTSTTLAYTHAYMKEADPQLGAIRGERLPGSPRFSASLIADYEFSPGPLRPSVGTTLRYVSDRTVDFDGDRPLNVQPNLPSYTLADIRGALNIGAANVQLYVHNLFDNHAQYSVILPQFGNRVAIAQPRTVGVTVSTRF
jgi:outer membrane receptor protein involved in Fe transport